MFSKNNKDDPGEDSKTDLFEIEKRLKFMTVIRPDAELVTPNSREGRLSQLKKETIEIFIGSMEARDLERAFAAPEIAREKLTTCLKDIADRKGLNLTRTELSSLLGELFDDIYGLGPLEPLLSNPAITEIMVNGPYQVFVELDGILGLSDTKFEDNAHLLRIIQRIVSPIGKRVDESSPIVDARLPDGSRVNAVINPIALDGSLLTIRKFSEDPLEMFDLIGFGALTEDMAVFLQACIRANLNLIVSGGTGSGKTTLLNILSSFIPEKERVITIEDSAELQIRKHHAHVGRMETRPPNVEGKGEVSTHDLIKASLRMRPDRIVVGECRGAEALDMLQAMNTGHDGSLTTAHANTPVDLIARLETMVLMGGVSLSNRAIRNQISSALDLIVQTTRLAGGLRKIEAITEVRGMSGEYVELADIFVFEQQGLEDNGKAKGEFKTIQRPQRFLQIFKERGIEFPEDLFPL